MLIYRRKLDRVDHVIVVLNLVDRVSPLPHIPEGSEASIVTGSEDRVMEFVMGNVFDFFVVEKEIADRLVFMFGTFV